MGYKFTDKDDAAFRDLLSSVAYVDGGTEDLSQPADDSAPDPTDPDAGDLSTLLARAREAEPGSEEFNQVIEEARALIATMPPSEELRRADEVLERLSVVNWETEYDMATTTTEDLLAHLTSTAGCAPCQQRAAEAASRAQARQRQAQRYAEMPQSARWSGVLGVEGELTGDGRLIAPGALRWESLPIPLRYVSADEGAHNGAVVVGRVTDIQRDEATGKILGQGDYDLGSRAGREAARMVEQGLMQGVSLDLDDVAFEVRVAAEAAQLALGEEPKVLTVDADEDGRVVIDQMSSDDEVTVTTSARIRAATQVAVPAFATAMITLTADATPLVEPDFNWVEDVGGLPSYIKRIAKHLEKKGMTEGHAIAVAVNAVKKMCATGDLNFPGSQQVNAGSRAEACAAVADWEAKKARARASGADVTTFQEEPDPAADTPPEAEGDGDDADDSYSDVLTALDLLDQAAQAGFPSDEYMDLAEQAAEVLGTAVEAGDLEPDQQQAAQEMYERIQDFLATDWSGYGTEESDIGAGEEDTLLAVAPPDDAAASGGGKSGGKERVRVPKGNPEGGQFKETPTSRLKESKDRFAKGTPTQKRHAAVGAALRNAMALTKRLLEANPDNPKLQALQKSLADVLATRRANAKARAEGGTGEHKRAGKGSAQDRLTSVLDAIDSVAASTDTGLNGDQKERFDRIMQNIRQNAPGMRAHAGQTSRFRDYKPETRKRLSKEKKAMPDGSFPISNCGDLSNAIKAIGRAKDPDAVRAHIKRRAKDLKCRDVSLPEGWAVVSPRERAFALAFAYDKDQWRNPRTGQWINMPDVALGNLADVVEGLDFGDDGALGKELRDLADEFKKGDDEYRSDMLTKVQKGLDKAAKKIFPSRNNDALDALAQARRDVDAYQTSWVPQEETDIGRGDQANVGEISGLTLDEVMDKIDDLRGGLNEADDTAVSGLIRDLNDLANGSEHADSVDQIKRRYRDLRLGDWDAEMKIKELLDGLGSEGEVNPEGEPITGPVGEGERPATILNPDVTSPGPITEQSTADLRRRANDPNFRPEDRQQAADELIRRGEPVGYEPTTGSPTLDEVNEENPDERESVDADWGEPITGPVGEGETELPWFGNTTLDDAVADHDNGLVSDEALERTFYNEIGNLLDDGDTAQISDILDALPSSPAATTIDDAIADAENGHISEGERDRIIEDAIHDLLAPLRRSSDVEYASEEDIMSTTTLRAAAPPVDPDLPPAEFFSDPQFTAATALTVTKEGRVMGHLATWGTCHLTHTAQGKCVVAPTSSSRYAYFHTGSVLTAEGAEIPVGHITLDTRHATDDMSPAATLAHYDNTGLVAADIVVGEDQFGIWFSGALRPGVSSEKVRALRSAPLSGDWRRIGTGLELVAALAVNVPGFPVPRPRGMVAGGAMTSLVAAGMLPPRRVRRPGTPGALSVDDLRYLKRLAARERAEEAESRIRTLDKAKRLAIRLRAQAMAARVRGR